MDIYVVKIRDGKSKADLNFHRVEIINLKPLLLSDEVGIPIYNSGISVDRSQLRPSVRSFRS